jgi:hypothetical protein
LRQHAKYISLDVLQALNVIPIRSPSLTAAAEATVQRVSAPCPDVVRVCRVLCFPVLVPLFCFPVCISTEESNLWSAYERSPHVIESIKPVSQGALHARDRLFIPKKYRKNTEKKSFDTCLTSRTCQSGQNNLAVLFQRSSQTCRNDVQEISTNKSFGECCI